MSDWISNKMNIGQEQTKQPIYDKDLNRKTPNEMLLEEEEGVDGCGRCCQEGPIQTAPRCTKNFQRRSKVRKVKLRLSVARSLELTSQTLPRISVRI